MKVDRDGLLVDCANSDVFPVTDVVPKYTEPADGFAKVERVEGPVPQILSQDERSSQFPVELPAWALEDGNARPLTTMPRPRSTQKP
jgi:hypothetical protein